ncbi:MAG: hypothetical protein KDA61_19470, partial [Planctomycetales bacterium]|nr:hypothetical protein [Planctomycetales bacterium]
GIGTEPIGRNLRVPWPQGVESQAVTVLPPGSSNHKARLVVERVDGGVFDLPAFSIKLLANTAGAGADIEVMPSLQGEDAFDDPIAFGATGYYGQSFSYGSTGTFGNTAQLHDFDRYSFSLYVDFALTSAEFAGAPTGLDGDFNSDGVVDGHDFLTWQVGDSPIPLSRADLDAWQGGFGGPFRASNGIGAVPEPCELGWWTSVLTLFFRGGGLRLRRK